MIDYHLHTNRCGHATGTMEAYLTEAETKNISEIGFADHFPLGLLGYVPDHPVSMGALELEDYMADVKRLRELAAIPIRLGVEVDYLPGREAVTAEALAGYPFDYVMGSIHFLDGWDFTNPCDMSRYSTMDIDGLYHKYFTVVKKLAESRLFDIVGHLDVVKKFSFFPRENWDDVIAATCRALADNGLCVELNTAGWRAPVGEAYPAKEFLRTCLQLGVPVTLGSDAHIPQDVGSDLDRAVSLLIGLGFSEIATFVNRKRVMRPL
jgi:histidinol-phosphatase (PHP family)